MRKCYECGLPIADGQYLNTSQGTSHADAFQCVAALRAEVERLREKIKCLREEIASVTADRDERAAQKGEFFTEIEKLRAENFRLTSAMRATCELADTGTDRHRATFGPRQIGYVLGGWRVAEKMREVLLDAMKGDA